MVWKVVWISTTYPQENVSKWKTTKYGVEK